LTSALCSGHVSSLIAGCARRLSSGDGFHSFSRCARCHLSGYPPRRFCMLTLLHVRLLTLLVMSSKVRSLNNFQLRFSAGKWALVLPRGASGTVIARGSNCCDSSIVIPLLYVVPLPTTNPLRLLLVPYRLVRIDSEVDFL
jgi:hypothetical protein